VLNKELFQLSRLSITQVWPGYCHHVMQLWGSVFHPFLFNIGWGSPA
jgi:hypothetical protein